MFGCLLGWYTTYTFSGALAPDGILPHVKYERRTFALKCCIRPTALPEFNQSLLDIFSLVDLQLILTLLYDSLIS